MEIFKENEDGAFAETLLNTMMNSGPTSNAQENNSRQDPQQQTIQQTDEEKTLSPLATSKLRRWNDRMNKTHVPSEKEKTATNEYWKKVNATAPNDEGTAQWFAKELKTRHKAFKPQIIEKFADKVDEFLLMAYENNVKSEHVDFVLDENTKRVLTIAASWCKNHTKPCLLIRGGVGVGKTTLMEAIADVYYILEKKTISIVHATDVNKIAQKESDFEKLKKTEMLGIDDLGIENIDVKIYGNECTPIAELLNYRHKNNLFTIVTTNLFVGTKDGKEINEIEQRYGRRIEDRMKRYNVIAYNGNQRSYRK